MATSDPALPLQGKLAIVTGASRGLGEGIAFELASRGASVVLAYVSENSRPKVEALAARIEALPHRPATHAVAVDLGSETGAQELVESVCRWRGGAAATQVDILVNNAGVERARALGEATAADFAAVYDVNVRGPLLLTQAVLPHLRAPGGRVVNVGSVGARAGLAGLGLYCSSKAALEGLTRCWAAELGPRAVTVNCVNPGPVQSDMLAGIPPAVVAAQKAATPLENRLGTVPEVANVVAALAGRDGAWITGQVISASGGWAMY